MPNLEGDHTHSHTFIHASKLLQSQIHKLVETTDAPESGLCSTHA